MARLLDDLLDVSRIAHGRITIRKERLDLASVIEQAMDSVRPKIESHRHQVHVERPTEPLFVEGDRVRLSQVVENLLANAAKYTPDGGRIAVILARQGDKAVVRIRDNGRGIPAEMLQSVFDLFVQSDDTLDRADGGMGVGLTLVRSLVELHGGSVTATSDGPGKGSEFVVSLPLGQAVATTLTAPARPRQPRVRGC